jgi:hypothetical protein
MILIHKLLVAIYSFLFLLHTFLFVASEVVRMPKWDDGVKCGAVTQQAGGSALNTSIHLVCLFEILDLKNKLSTSKLHVISLLINSSHRHHLFKKTLR